MAQYDSIAFDYQRISAAVPLRDAEWCSMIMISRGLEAAGAAGTSRTAEKGSSATGDRGCTGIQKIV
jgi:hypothetical protein